MKNIIGFPLHVIGLSLRNGERYDQILSVLDMDLVQGFGDLGRILNHQLIVFQADGRIYEQILNSRYIFQDTC